jgi:hypothetical protein
MGEAAAERPWSERDISRLQAGVLQGSSTGLLAKALGRSERDVQKKLDEVRAIMVARPRPLRVTPRARW